MHIPFIGGEADFAMGHLDLTLSKAVLGSLRCGISLASSPGLRGGKQSHFTLLMSSCFKRFLDVRAAKLIFQIPQALYTAYTSSQLHEEIPYYPEVFLMVDCS